MTADGEDFNVIQFEKKLTTLKDSQESINLCCQWCLSNRQHHKKIVNSWLNVLKRVKVEQRLVLFYLANDVIQYSKRRKYEYVESWGTALQKATTLVRDDRVKQKILRIFKIWEDRGVYNEEFISDLCGLISVQPTAPKNDEPHEFQAGYVINKIRVCSNLETDTDLKLKQLKELNPKILETDSYCNSLKDRAHLDDTEKELDCYVKYMEDYINALKVEVKNRIALISVLRQAEIQLDTDRKDVKIVANAYKSFGTRVKTFQKKLEEHRVNLASPIPSPDVNAPSPTSDSDIDLPPDGAGGTSQDSQSSIPSQSQAELDLTNVQITNANYYNPVPAPATESSGSQFIANGFTSFIGSMSFNVQTFNTSNLFSGGSTNNVATSDPTQMPPSLVGTSPSSAPLLPPPMPPFGAKENSGAGAAAAVTTTGYDMTGYDNERNDYGQSSFNASFNPDTSIAPPFPPPSYGPTNNAADSSYDPISAMFGDNNSCVVATTTTAGNGAYEAPLGANPYPPPTGPPSHPPHHHSNRHVIDTDEYNPEEEPQTWDTPESPPPFEKEAYGDPMVEYHDNPSMCGRAAVGGGALQGREDVDHRLLPPTCSTNERAIGRGAQDIDHRNLISLIGSPATDSNSNQLPGIETTHLATSDQDYRVPVTSSSHRSSTGPFADLKNSGGGSLNRGDQDYRLPYDIEQQLKLPPPPPPPPSSTDASSSSSFKMNNNSKNVVVHPIPVVSANNQHKKQAIEDNVESIDMDLSDDDAHASTMTVGGSTSGHAHQGTPNLKMLVDPSTSSLEDCTNSSKTHHHHHHHQHRSSSSIRSPSAEDFESQNSGSGGGGCATELPSMLEPPPPLPDFPDDAEENLFLDQMSNDLNDFLPLNPDEVEENLPEPFWNCEQPPPLPPPQQSSLSSHSRLQPPPMFTSGMTSMPPPIGPPPGWMNEPPPPSHFQHFNNNNNNNSGGGGNALTSGFHNNADHLMEDNNRGQHQFSNNINNKGRGRGGGGGGRRGGGPHWQTNNTGNNNSRGFRGRGGNSNNHGGRGGGNQRFQRGHFHRGNFRGNRGGGGGY